MLVKSKQIISGFLDFWIINESCSIQNISCLCFCHRFSSQNLIVLSKNYLTVVVLPTKFLFLRKMKEKVCINMDVFYIPFASRGMLVTYIFKCLHTYIWIYILPRTKMLNICIRTLNKQNSYIHQWIIIIRVLSWIYDKNLFLWHFLIIRAIEWNIS